MLTAKISTNGDLVIRELEQLAERLADPRPALERFGEHMLDTSIPKNFAQGGRPERWSRSPWATREPQKDTGRLMRSARYRVLAGGRIRVGSNLRQAALRQDGGEIRPKRAKALVIPLPDVIKSMRRPRAWGRRLFLLRSNKPDTLGVLATADSAGNIAPRFVLRTRVKQPARPWIVFHNEDLEHLQQLLLELAEGRRT